MSKIPSKLMPSILSACVCSLLFACSTPQSLNTANNTQANNIVTAAPTDELEQIYQNYQVWIVGAGKLSKSDPLVAAQHQAMLETFADIEQKFDAKGGVVGLGKVSFARTKDKQPVARYVFDELLPALSMSYAYPGLVDDANPRYRDPALLAKAIDVLDFMHKGGWQKGVNTGFDFEALKRTGFTGFGGSMNNNISGYSKTLLLLRDDLAKAGRLDRELATLDWVTRIFAPPAAGEEAYQLNFPGFNSDGFKSMVRNRLSYIAAQPQDAPDRERNMRYLQKFYNKAYMLAPGWADTIKPDGLGYHHKGFYGNSYSQEAFEAAARSMFILRGTSYQVSQQSIDNVKLGLATFRNYSQKYDMHRGGTGRFPDSLNSLLSLLPAYAYLGGESGLNDEEVKAMFARLWDRDYFEQNNSFASKFKRKGLGAFGELATMLAVEAEQATPEAALSGHWVYPYGAMSIHRRPGWMAAVKGFNRYIWDYESSKTQNLYGGNASSGVLRIYSKGEPVNAFDSGFGEKGWDWHRLPGATTVRAPYKKMKGKHRNFSNQAFVGGLSAENSNGVYAMRYENQVAKVPLTANKSLFFFDDQIVLLGSDIQGGNGKYAIDTTLFQTRIADENIRTHINGKAYTGDDLQKTFSSAQSAWLTDSVNNGYYLPNSENLNVHRAIQQAPNSKGKKQTKDLYSTAWLAHGKKVQSASYEYVVLVDAGADKTAEFAANAKSIYQVRQQNSQAHIVEHKAKGLTGYALFKAGNSYNSSLITASDSPALAMVRKLDDGGIVLSVANPNLALSPADKKITATDLRDSAKWLYSDSKTPAVTLTLQGHWSQQQSDALSAEDTVKVTTATENGKPITRVMFKLKHAKSYNLKLR